jgi:preprotein translocase subunit Sec61beta
MVRPRDVAKNKDSGFHSAAGLIRYFDQEDEKALKIPPAVVVLLCIVISAIVLYVTFAWPV